MLEHINRLFATQLPHVRGLRFLREETSNVTTAWGVDWTDEMIARDLMQNFFDANKTNTKAIHVRNNGGDVTISAPAEFDLGRLYYLGSEKGEDDVGEYGEGFKAAAVCFLRETQRVVLAVSGKQALAIYASREPVAGSTTLYPLIYAYFECEPTHGTTLVLTQCSRELATCLTDSLRSFFYAENPLLGERLFGIDRFSLYRSTTTNGFIFYRNLLRGEIPNVPLIFVIHRSYADIEKKIGADRDRKAFGDNLREYFYTQIMGKFFSGEYQRQRKVLEATKHLWEQGNGHPLLAAMARTYTYEWRRDPSRALDVFGTNYYAKSTEPDSMAARMQYAAVEEEWQKLGRIELPGYFVEFGLPTIETHLNNLASKAKEEARKAGQRLPSEAEGRCLRFLMDRLAELDPLIRSVFEKGRVLYSIAKTDVLLGELRQNRAYKSREVFFAESVFEFDFAKALAIFLHEHGHIFGHDGSRGFTDALTELLEQVVRQRAGLANLESDWQQLQYSVQLERQRKVNEPVDPLADLVGLPRKDLLARLRTLPPRSSGSTPERTTRISGNPSAWKGLRLLTQIGSPKDNSGRSRVPARVPVGLDSFCPHSLFPGTIGVSANVASKPPEDNKCECDG